MVKPMAPPTELGTGIAASPAAPTLSEAQQRQLPIISPGAPAGSVPFYQGELERAIDARRDDKMSDHPSFFGKLGHVLGRVGNVALDVVAPGIALNIPGTDMYKMAEQRRAEENLAGAQERESRQRLESAETREAEARAGKLESEGGNQELVTDSAGNLAGWRDEDGKLHSFEEEGTPQVLKDIRKDWEGKNQRPENFEQAMVGAVQRSLAAGRKPADDPEVQALAQAIKDFKPSKDKDVNTVEDLKHRIVVAMESGDVDTALRLQGQLQATDPEGMQRMAETRMQHELLQEDRMDKRREREEKEAEDIVRGYDKNGNEFITSKGNARDMGLQHMTKATAKEIDDAKQNYAALNDMGAKVRNARNSAAALDQNPYQKTLIQTALAGTPDSYGTRAAVALMTEQSKAYVQDIFSLREAALALPKQTTGGSRVSEPQAHALWNTIPGTSGNSKYAVGQLRKFDENLSRLWKKVPGIEGQTAERPFGEETSAGGGAAGGPPRAPKPGMKWQQNKRTGEYREVPESQ
jgi:hypothetical protein